MRLVIITASSISILIVLGVFIIPYSVQQQDNGSGMSTSRVGTQNQTNTQSQFNDIEKNIPQQLTSEQLDEAVHIALSDSQVQKMTSGQPTKLMSQGFSGNYKSNSGVWLPQLNFNVNNKTQIVVLVDLSEKKVVDSFVGIPIGTNFDPKSWQWGSSIGNKTIEMNTRLSSGSVTNDIHYLYFRFFDASTNQTVPHVSFFLTIAQGNDTLMHGLFHTHTGILELQVKSIDVPFNGTVIADRESDLGGWMPHNDEPVIVYAPVFNDANSTYSLNAKLGTIDQDNNILASDTAPQFDFTLDMKDQNKVITTMSK